MKTASLRSSAEGASTRNRTVQPGTLRSESKSNVLKTPGPRSGGFCGTHKITVKET